jgi:hypothetical protein
VPAVQVSRLLGRVFSVFGCLQAVSMGDMRVVACCLVVARISMFSRFPMMQCGTEMSWCLGVLQRLHANPHTQPASNVERPNAQQIHYFGIRIS